jgi:hypothetical protein
MAARDQSQILAQIRDGKRFWSYAEIGNDFDAFRSKVVEPLRRLKYDGVIVALSEIESLVAGREQITGVEIIGGIKAGPEADEE